jgi:hypothetical protein
LAQRVLLYRAISIVAQTFAYGLQVARATVRPLNGLCRFIKRIFTPEFQRAFVKPLDPAPAR